MNRALVDYIPETEAFGDESSILGEVSGQAFLDEFDEMELAADLLEVRDEAALERLLARLLRRRSAAGNKDGAVAARALRPLLKQAARRAIPAGGANRASGAPRGDAENEAALYFGLDPEGLSDEDREFEVARSFVRFADAALRQALAAASQHPASPSSARRAALLAARRHAPGLIRTLAPYTPSGPSAPAGTGRWQRQGRNLVIVGC